MCIIAIIQALKDTLWSNHDVHNIDRRTMVAQKCALLISIGYHDSDVDSDSDFDSDSDSPTWFRF